MSFITKRERVFNEYDLFDLPARNEGKLKAYSSCTDARAWSHFCSDKTEHLVEIIKRNNETHRPKYVPTDVIVNTLMTSKNAEIGRLKRKIEEFEQMLAAYDQLDLTCDQKCEIANAHAAIKAANKELDEMCLDLDLSGFTEGIDSEAFETGKSRGDEPSRYTGETGKSRGDEWTMAKVSTPRMETKGNQVETTCKRDASTSARDKRIDEMQDTIISKDAKLSAMQNTIAVMESDVCEPYCIYAHIYTALEKIFGTLCQNGKYKQYLDLLTAGKDTRGIDIKGKILFKMKVLEKFSLALIAPCSQDFNSKQQDCTCYHAEIVTHVETSFALTSAESIIPSLDNKRAQLVADIMQNEDMKEILSKESLTQNIEDDQFDDPYAIENYDIDSQNLIRLKNLQANYEDLLNCYDNLKHERDNLNIRCQKYMELENQCECLHNKLKEYNQLWKEKEYYRKRSEDLDALKENYYVLSEETSNVETKLKTEQQINKIKSSTVDELKSENLKLENKISEICLSFEKQKNSLICKLKECECKMMCQEQQIKSLTNQIDGLLGADNKICAAEDDTQSTELIDEIKSQKEQIKNLKDALCCNEEEKQCFQEELEQKLTQINQLKIEIEEWKTKYEKTIEANNYLEKYLEKCHLQINDLRENNNTAIENLNHIIYNKSQEISHLIEEVEYKNDENQKLVEQVKSIHEDFENKLTLLESEKKIALNSIHSARKQSQEILENLKNYDNINDNESNKSSKSLQKYECQVEVKGSEKEIDQTMDIDNKNFLKEIQLLREINLKSAQLLQNENNQLKRALELNYNENEKLKKEILQQEDIMERFHKLTESHEILLSENEKLQCEISDKTIELDNVLQAFQLTKKESETLIDQLHKSECVQEEYVKINKAYQKIITERDVLQNKLLNIENELKDLQNSQKNLREENELLHLNLKNKINVEEKLSDLEEKYNKLIATKNILQKNYNDKTDEINNLYYSLENKTEENRNLHDKLKKLETSERLADENINSLKKVNSNIQLQFHNLKKESMDLKNKLKNYEQLQIDFNDLVLAHNDLKLKKENLQKDLEVQQEDVKKMQQEIYNLNNERKTLLTHNNDLEKALIQSRNKNIPKSDSNISYEDIRKEIENLREEKISYHKKIGDLLDKLDKSDFLISDLNEIIISKDKKISTLENHINELEDEIRKLQYNLNQVIESGEQIRQLSCEKMKQSFKIMEAHHSKATHNMKMELAQLQNKNVNLENQLCSTKLITEDSYKDTNYYITQITDLQKEKQEIISKIEQLEVESLGDSILSSNNCTIDKVIIALDRINKYIKEKNISLQRTLSNVQASYQLLKTKADEAKTIAERERQNIINEKEEIHREREIVKERLENLKKEKEQSESIIKDLEREMLNQTLIFNKVKELNENDITKLKEENISLQDLYENSLNSIKDLQEKFDTAGKDKNNYIVYLKNAESTIEEKNKEIATLQKYIEEIKNKRFQHVTTQTAIMLGNNDVGLQTDAQDNLSENINGRKSNILTTIDNLQELLKLNEQENLEFFEALKAKNIKLTIDIVKDIYINYKMKRLSLGRLEQYSTTDLCDNKISDDDENKILKNLFNVKSPVLNNLSSSIIKDSVIDIYNSQMYSDSTKNSYYNENHTSNYQTENLESNTITGIANNNNLSAKKSFNDSVTSTDKDVFLIYTESQSNSDDHNNTEKKSWPQNGFQNMIVERAIIHTKKDPLYFKQEPIENINEGLYDKKDDVSVKLKLKINIPRVFTDHSTASIMDEDVKSLDSYNQHVSSSFMWLINSDTKLNSKNCKNIKKPNFASIILNRNDQEKNKLKIKNFDNDKTNKTRIPLTKLSIKPIDNINSKSNLSRINADTAVLKYNAHDDLGESTYIKSNYALKYILDSVQNDINLNNNSKSETIKALRKSQSEEIFCANSESIQPESSSLKILLSNKHKSTSSNTNPTKSTDCGILVKMDTVEDYENKIHKLNDTLKTMEKYYKRKIEAIKTQCESNVKHIITEHNQGVESIQSLHEETINEIIKKHENEIENLRTMSIEAMCKAERLENENQYLKSKVDSYNNMTLDEIPIKIPTPELKKVNRRSRPENRTLTKTFVDAFNVKPKRRSHGPCTCSLDMNISDTIRNIFEQVDVDQRKMAEIAYLKYIAKKILNDNVGILDTQELSFLHLKVCRTWKARLHKEETLRKRIDSLEGELMNKQRETQEHMAELNRKVAEEWCRLQEVREAVCKGAPNPSRDCSPEVTIKTSTNAEEDTCNCKSVNYSIALKERHSAGDLEPKSCLNTKSRSIKLESKRAVLAKLDVDQRREKRIFNDETPTRLKRSHDRQQRRTIKK